MSISGYEVISNESAPAVIAHGTGANVDVSAPSGKVVIGGGYLLGSVSLAGSFAVAGSYPIDSSTAWRVTVRNDHASASCEVTVFAICADA